MIFCYYYYIYYDYYHCYCYHFCCNHYVSVWCYHLRAGYKVGNRLARGWTEKSVYLLINFVGSCQEHHTNHAKTSSHDLTYTMQAMLAVSGNQHAAYDSHHMTTGLL